MRKPRLALGAPEQVALEPERQSLRALVLGEDEHADAARLAVAAHLEDGRLRLGAADAQSVRHLVDPGARLAAEKGEREVQFVARNDASALEAGLPLGDRVESRVGKTKAAEEPDCLIAFDPSALCHAEL